MSRSKTLPPNFSALSPVRARMLMRHFFFATIMVHADPQIVPDDMFANMGAPVTAGTDMKHIYFGESFFAKLSLDEAVFVMCHEVAHIVLMHGLRRGTRDPALWNEACDHAINLWLVECGLSMPKGELAGLCDMSYREMTAEQIYELLPKDPNRKSRQRGQFDNDLMPPGPMDDMARATLEQEIQQHVAQATMIARQQGELSAGLERVIKNVLDSRVPWYDKLRIYLSELATASETWSRRNRRFEAILPGKHPDEAMDEIVIIGDTSGSIGQRELDVIASEINGIREQVRPRVTRVIWADDAECSAMQTFDAGEVLALKPVGGGGTDMRKPLRYVEQFRPKVVILVTDCATPWPDAAPPYPLIVVSTSNMTPPDYAQHVSVEL